MNKYEKIELVGKAEIEESVTKRIATTGVRGLSFEKANELGLFTRISLLLTAMHMSSVASYKVYKQVEDLLDAFGGRRNDIAKACNDFNKAMEKFENFWTDYYKKNETLSNVDYEVSCMYDNILRWSGIPKKWTLGEEQTIKEKSVDSSIVIDNGDTLLRMSSSVINEENVEYKESWSVTKYDVDTRAQTTVHSDMDKTSAMMVAKRLSAEDEHNIYTASRILDVVKKETVVTPIKAFQANNTIGKISNKISM